MSQNTFACPPEHVQQLQGIDWAKLDFTKIVAIVQMLVSLFGGQVTPQAVKAACPGCPDECAAHCCEAARLALEAAHHSLQCCQDMAQQSNP